MTDPDDALASARLGERWVVRRRLPDGSATDVVGWVDALTPSTVTGRHSRGSDLRGGPGRGPGCPASACRGRRTRPAPGECGGPRTARPDRLAGAQRTPRRLDAPGRRWVHRARELLSGGGRPRPADPRRRPQRIVDYAALHRITPMAQVILGSAAEAGLRAEGWVDSYVTTDVLVAPLGPSWAIGRLIRGCR